MLLDPYITLGPCDQAPRLVTSCKSANLAQSWGPRAGGDSQALQMDRLSLFIRVERTDLFPFHVEVFPATIFFSKLFGDIPKTVSDPKILPVVIFIMLLMLHSGFSSNKIQSFASNRHINSNGNII